MEQTYTPFSWEAEKEIPETDIRYVVRLKDYPLFDETGEMDACMFSYSYIRRPEDSKRPVIFAYNGGPGAASSWVHLGLLGPRKLELEDFLEKEGRAGWKLADNPDTILDSADVVLIDPVGTSFSVITKGEARSRYYTTTGDARTFVDFIENWLKENHRERSPIYLLGESYGTIRNVAVADLLPETIHLKGIISIGTSLNVGAAPLPVEPNVRRLAANAAACWYHFHQEEMKEETFLKEADAFAYGPYAHALLMGSRLPKEERDEVAEKLAYYSGMDKAFLKEHGLRYTEPEFLTRVYPGKVISTYDSRLTLPFDPKDFNPDMLNSMDNEPFMTRVGDSFDEAIAKYLKEELAVPEGRTYNPEPLMDIALGWNYRDMKKSTMDLPVELMKRREDLKFFFVAGYYDLQSTFDFLTYYLSQYDLPEERTLVKVYQSGHASYVGGNNAEEITEDIRKLMQEEV